MRFDGREIVEKGLEQSFSDLCDGRALRACVPGLEKLEGGSDKFDAILAVALPAITGRFEGTLEFLERRRPDFVKLRVRGRGPLGFVDGHVEFAISSVDEGTSFEYSADVQVGGEVARLGQRVMSGIARQTAGHFFMHFEDWRGERPEQRSAHESRSQGFIDRVWLTIRRALELARKL